MNVVEIINEAIASGRTRFAFELLPPLKGDGMQKIFAAVEPLMALDPAYVNITFHREGIKETEREDGSVEWHVVRRRPGTVGISAAIQNRYGVEVVPHLICGGLSKYDIEDTLIDMDFLGLHNVLALRGDKSQNEKRFMPHPQGHAHAVDLVRQIADMNRGKFIDGEVEECHHSKFSIGVAGYPEVHAEARDITSDIAACATRSTPGRNMSSRRCSSTMPNTSTSCAAAAKRGSPCRSSPASSPSRRCATWKYCPKRSA